ncbi:MmgE/PrpD family protein [Amycolatopsis thermoflava]
MHIERTLWERARVAADSATTADLERARGCLAVSGTEMLKSAAQPRFAAVARSLDLAGSTASALSYLNHANLADDSFEVACHPGLSVGPVVLSHATRTPLSDAEITHAVIVGYEVACSLTSLLLPEAAQRGWRVTSVVAPIAAAAVTAQLRGFATDTAVHALGLAATFTGGSVSAVNDPGDAWRFQPAAATQAGVTAAAAAEAGARIEHSAMSGEHSLGRLFGPGDLALGKLPAAGSAIHAVTFKKYETAMFGQAIMDAVAAVPPGDPIDRLELEVCTWTLTYGGDQTESPDAGIASVPGIFRSFAGSRLGVTDAGALAVSGDAALDPLSARLTVRRRGGRVETWSGSGDTSFWRSADFETHCRRRIPHDNPMLAAPAGDAGAAAGACLSAILAHLHDTVRPSTGSRP